MPEIDYAALAEQARKAANQPEVDYAALAEQARQQAGSLRPEKDTLSKALDMLPAVGGGVGGILGGIAGAAVPLFNLTGAPEAAGAVGGAALGGAAGETVRRGIEALRGTGGGLRPQMGNPIVPVLQAGAEQGGAELLGRGLVAGAGKLAKPLANTAERIINSNVKPNPGLVRKNPGINIPRVILDEGFSQGEKGAGQARALTADLSDNVSALNAADAAKGKTYSLQPLLDNLAENRTRYLQSPAGTPDVTAVDKQIAELMHHPVYSKEVAPDVRALIPQNASQLDVMKRGIYEANPNAYGMRQGAVVEGEKAQGRALKGIMDANVPGVQEINQRQSGVITARKALDAMAAREANKYPLGLMDLMAAGASAGGAAINPLLGIPPVAVALLKHPSTAFPIAKGLNATGAMLGKRATPKMGAATANALRLAILGLKDDPEP